MLEKLDKWTLFICPIGTMMCPARIFNCKATEKYMSTSM